MTRCLVLSFFLLNAINCRAGSIQFAQWIPWNFVINNFINQSLTQTFQKDNFVLQAGEFRPEISLSASMTGTLSELDFKESGIFAKYEMHTVIQVQRLYIDQIISRELNGNIFQVHIKSQCTPFQIVVKEYTTDAKLVFKSFEDYWVPDLNSINLNIPDNPWEITPFSCSGIGGLGEEIKKQINAVMRNPDSLESVLTSFLAGEISNVFNEAWSSLKSGTGNSFTITSVERPDDKGFMVYAEMLIDKPEYLKISSFPRELSNERPQFILSSEGFSALLEERINKLIPQGFNLQNISAFSSLMKSRSKQYFAWPDLRRFQQTTPFYFFTDTQQTRMVLKETAKGNYEAFYNTNGKLLTVIGTSEIDYIVFGVGLKTTLKVELKDGILTLATGNSSNLALAWNYGAIYQIIYRPKNRIAVDILKRSIVEIFNNQKHEEILPSIKIKGHDLKLNNWKQFNGIITMDWL